MPVCAGLRRSFGSDRVGKRCINADRFLGPDPDPNDSLAGQLPAGERFLLPRNDPGTVFRCIDSGFCDNQSDGRAVHERKNDIKRSLILNNHFPIRGV